MAAPKDAKSRTVDTSGLDASLYNNSADFVYSSENTAHILSLLDAQPGERVIDFGCGSGEVTLRIKELVGETGLVVGVDASPGMIEQAKKNGVANAFVADIQNLPLDVLKAKGEFSQPFDAVFSNATLHWCKRDPLGVLQSARQILKPGGRIVVEMGGFLNCIGVRAAIHEVLKNRGHDPVLDPWFFPSTEEYKQLLLSKSFKPTHMSLTPRLTPLPSGLRSWLQTFVRNSFLQHLEEEEAGQIMQEIEELCRVDCTDSKGNWAMMYVRLKFCAIVQ